MDTNERKDPLPSAGLSAGECDEAAFATLPLELPEDKYTQQESPHFSCLYARCHRVFGSEAGTCLYRAPEACAHIDRVVCLV